MEPAENPAGILIRALADDIQEENCGERPGRDIEASMQPG